MALFDSRQRYETAVDVSIVRDCLLIGIIVIPMFVLALRFWTAPVYLNYTIKLNAFVVPLALVVVFFAQHVDVILLGILVLIMNIYVFWYHVDPPQ